MANYKILSDISTLGAQGATVTDEQLEAEQLNAELLIASGVIEPQNKTTKTDKEN